METDYLSSISRKLITFFIENNIKIKKICININDNTFWITNKDKVYGNGCTHNNLGDDTLINKSTPFLIDGIKNVSDIKSSAKYSIAICKTEPNITDIIKNWWRISVRNGNGDGSRNETGNRNNNEIYNADIIDLIDAFFRKNVIFSTMNQNEVTKGWTQLKIFDDKNIIKIESGRDHSLFLSQSGDVYCYGFNTKGQLGINDHENIKISQHIQIIEFFIENKIKIKDIKCVSDHNLAIDINGKLYCWGCNDYGQCGDGNINELYLN